MASRVSIVRAQDAPPFVVYSEDQEVGRFGSLGAAFEAAQAAGGEINDDERSCLERWLLGAHREACEPGPAWLEKSFRRVHEASPMRNVGQSRVRAETRH
jgi:hypothetical protein